MKKIELYQYDKEFVYDRVQWVNKGLPKFLNFIKTKHKNLDSLYDDMNILTIGAYVLEKNKEKSITYLQYMMKALLGHFEQATYPGKQVEAEICGERISITGKENNDYKLGPTVWTKGVFFAIPLRDKESLSKFFNIPIQVMLNQDQRRLSLCIWHF